MLYCPLNKEMVLYILKFGCGKNGISHLLCPVIPGETLALV